MGPAGELPPIEKVIEVALRVHEEHRGCRRKGRYWIRSDLEVFVKTPKKGGKPVVTSVFYSPSVKKIDEAPLPHLKKRRIVTG